MTATDDADPKARGLQMLLDRVGLFVPPDDPMASLAAQIELSLERLNQMIDQRADEEAAARGTGVAATSAPEPPAGNDPSQS
jgi:hypothetical protein